MPADTRATSRTAKPPAIVVTGASSGIGKACVQYLDVEGFRVFAGVRKDADGDALRDRTSDNVQPMLLDVTDPQSVEAAARTVEGELKGTGLFGLVNNAGIAEPAPVEYVPMEMVRHQFEVNVFGQIAVTQAFMPMIREAGGRVINIGSIGDRITMPFGGVLCGCKSALASLTDALRMELHPWGIHVCLIEPATIATPGVDKTESTGHQLLESLPPEGARRYSKMFQTFLDLAISRSKEGSSPEVVAEVVYEALTEDNPKTRYLVGKNSRLLSSVARLPDGLLDRLRLRIFHLPTAFGELARHQLR